LLYEILTLGQEPYADMQQRDVIVEYLQTGKRLPKPELADELMYANFCFLFFLCVFYKNHDFGQIVTFPIFRLTGSSHFFFSPPETCIDCLT
jgi:hypothetical protein